MRDRPRLPTPVPGLSGPLAAVLLVGFWFAVGLLSASQYYLASLSAGGRPDLATQVLREAPGWQVWTLLTPLIFLVTRRFPLHREGLLRHLPVHLLASVACGFAAMLAWVLSTRLAVPAIRADYGFAEHFWTFFRVRFNVAFLLYWTLAAVFHGMVYYRRLRELELGAARAEVETSRAREEAARAREDLTAANLQALRSQLHPHFLFNTLHSIASYMEGDVRTARRLVARLGELLRTVLEAHDATEVPLSEELAFLGRYLEIEQIRFGERLRLEYEIDPQTEGALVPPLLLQPLAENAVRHGISPLESGGRISIRTRRAGPRLVLEVEDTGAGFRLPGRGGEGRGRDGNGAGVGLANTRARLGHLYGDDHRVDVTSSPSYGTLVTVEIPYRSSGTMADDD